MKDPSHDRKQCFRSCCYCDQVTNHANDQKTLNDAKLQDNEQDMKSRGLKSKKSLPPKSKLIKPETETIIIIDIKCKCRRSF